MYSVHLAKELFKFSCSHFTIFGPEEAERLHGHNYQVKVTIDVRETDAKLGFAFDFNLVKPMIRRICDEMDERILIQANSPYLRIKKSGSQIEVGFAKKNYSFPVEDTLSLPVVNISTEELARYIGEKLRAEMGHLPHWTDLEVNVEETRGQSVSYRLKR